MVQTTPAFRTLHREEKKKKESKKESRSSSVHAPSPKLSPFISAKQATALPNVFITLSRDRSPASLEPYDWLSCPRPGLQRSHLSSEHNMDSLGFGWADNLQGASKSSLGSS